MSVRWTLPRCVVALGLALLLAGATATQPAAGAVVVPDAGVAIRGSAEQKQREIDAAWAVGIRWTSHAVSWEELEPTRGEYRTPGSRGAAAWAALARELAYAKSRGMSVELRFSNAPAWASGRSGVGDDPPTPAQAPAYGVFLGDLARDLGGSIDAYSPWNEPNISNFWNPVDPAAYVRVQKIAYEAIKAQDPSATVLSAAIVGVYRGYEYLTAAYEAGLAGHADVIGWNAYPLGAPEEPYRDEEGRPAASSLPGQLYLRGLIDRYDPGRRVWLMEFSWSTCVACTGFPRNAATEAEQADYLRRAFLYRRQYLTGITDRIFWYQMRDPRVERNNWEVNQGLLRADFSPKPAYAAMRDVGVEVPDAGPGSPGRPAGVTPPGVGGALPAAAVRSTLPARAGRGARRIAIARPVIRSRRGYLVLTARVSVRGGATRLRVDGFRARWRTVTTVRLRRSATVRVRFVDRGYRTVRLRATLPGARGWRADRIIRVRAPNGGLR